MPSEKLQAVAIDFPSMAFWQTFIGKALSLSSLRRPLRIAIGFLSCGFAAVLCQTVTVWADSNPSASSKWPPSLSTVYLASEKTAQNIARNELKRRSLPCLASYKFKVEDSLVAWEFGDQYEAFLVTVVDDANSQKQIVYQMLLNKENGQIEDFADRRADHGHKLLR